MSKIHGNHLHNQFKYSSRERTNGAFSANYDRRVLGHDVHGKIEHQRIARSIEANAGLKSITTDRKHMILPQSENAVDTTTTRSETGLTLTQMPFALVLLFENNTRRMRIRCLPNGFFLAFTEVSVLFIR